MKEQKGSTLFSNPDDPRHGTRTGYLYGCRCERCVEANRKHQREYYKSRGGKKSVGISKERYKAKSLKELEANPEDPRHGTRNGYNIGCRCKKCRAANAEAARNYKLRKRRDEQED